MDRGSKDLGVRCGKDVTRTLFLSGIRSHPYQLHEFSWISSFVIIIIKALSINYVSSDELILEQDPGTPPARRLWPSLDVGTEIYVSREGETAEWELSDFDIIIPDPSQ